MKRRLCPHVAIPTHSLIFDVLVGRMLFLHVLIGQVDRHVHAVHIIRDARQPHVSLTIKGENPLSVSGKQHHVTSDVKLASLQQQRLGNVPVLCKAGKVTLPYHPLDLSLYGPHSSAMNDAYALKM